MLMVEVDAKKWAVEESEQMLVVVGEVLVPKMGGDALLVDERSVEESGQLVLQVVMSVRWMMVVLVVETAVVVVMKMMVVVSMVEVLVLEYPNLYQVAPVHRYRGHR